MKLNINLHDVGIDLDTQSDIFLSSRNLYNMYINIKRTTSVSRKHSNISCKSGCKLDSIECNIIGFYQLYIYVIYNDYFIDDSVEIYKKHIPVLYKSYIVKLPIKALSPITRTYISIIRYIYTRSCLINLGLISWFDSFKLLTGKCGRNNRIFIMCNYFFPHEWNILEYFIKNFNIEPYIGVDEYMRMQYTGLNTLRKIYSYLVYSPPTTLVQNNILYYINKKQ